MRAGWFGFAVPMLAAAGLLATAAPAQRGWGGDRYGRQGGEHGGRMRVGRDRLDLRGQRALPPQFPYARDSRRERDEERQGYARGGGRPLRCDRGNGNIIGAIAGGLLGNGAAGRAADRGC